MVAIKHHEADRFLKNIDAKLCAVLFFGPDTGLAAERAHRLAKSMAEREKPAGEILQFEEHALVMLVDVLGGLRHGEALILRIPKSERR